MNSGSSYVGRSHGRERSRSGARTSRQDGVERGAGVHPRHRLVVQDLEQLGRLGERLAHARRALDGRAVPGQEQLRAEALHLPQGGGPLAGVALHLLRVPAVRRGPDEEVPRHGAPGAPGARPRCGRPSRPARGGAPASRRRRARSGVAVHLVGIAVLAPGDAPGAELPAVDHAVVPGREAVPVEARRHGLVRDHPRPRRAAAPPPPRRARRPSRGRRGRACRSPCGRGATSTAARRRGPPGP